MLVDRIEWLNNKSLPTSTEIHVEVKDYMEIKRYLESMFEDEVRAFRYRANGLLNMVRF